jgi:hypothetical protein
VQQSQTCAPPAAPSKGQQTTLCCPPSGGFINPVAASTPATGIQLVPMKLVQLTRSHARSLSVASQPSITGICAHHARRRLPPCRAQHASTSHHGPMTPDGHELGMPIDFLVFSLLADLLSEYSLPAFQMRGL